MLRLHGRWWIIAKSSDSEDFPGELSTMSNTTLLIHGSPFRFRKDLGAKTVMSRGTGAVQKGSVP